MKLNIKPLADRVVIQPIAPESKTKSGLIIPENAKDKPQKGKVLAVGSGKKDEPLTVKINDNVLFSKYSGSEITFEENTYLIMRENEILAII